MGQTLAERIDWEAANDPNRMISAYAGDLADLVAELTARAEQAGLRWRQCRGRHC